MKYRCNTSSSTAGFSLLEMLAIAVIIGILAAIAAPGWVSFMNQRRAASGSDQLAQLFRKTQNDAQRLRRSRGIKFVPAASSSTGVPEIIVGTLTDSNSDGTLDDVVGEAFLLGEGQFSARTVELAAFDNNDNPVDFLVFEADGSLSLDPAATPQPITLRVSSPASGSSPAKRCIMVETLLGAISSGAGSECD
ncbi:MAG: hypothetical protein ACFB8W_14185 [Elainellaceae cyanobacterium]